MSYESLTTGANAPTWRLQGDADLNGTGDANAILGPANGSWTGTAGYVDPPAGKGDGKAFSFASGHIVLTAADSLRPQNDDWSCSFWFRLTSTAAQQTIWSSGSQFSTRPNISVVYNASTDTLDVYIANGTSHVDGTRIGLRSANTFTDTDWHFATISFNRSTNVASMWRDGVLAGVLFGSAATGGVDTTGVVPNFAADTRLGGTFPAATQTAVELYDYRVYDGVALDAADDAALYAGPTASNRRKAHHHAAAMRRNYSW